jgi:rubrerythrin
MAGQDGGRRIGVLDHMQHETVRFYDAALQKVDDQQLRGQLQQFRDDHDRCARELDDLAGSLGAWTGEPSQQFHAFVEEHLQVVQQAQGKDQALEGLLLMEEANLGEVRRGIQEGLQQTGDLLDRMLDDEQRDVDFIAKNMRPSVGIDDAAKSAVSGTPVWTMSEQECAVMCSGLRFLDEQTSIALDTAAEISKDQATQAQLQEFAEDHRRHVKHLDELLGGMGGTQLPTEELQHYMHEAVASVGRAKDADDAMDRLLLLERANAAEYGSVARAQMPSDEAQRLMEKHHIDEQHHVAWIEQHSPVGAAYGTSSGPRVGEDPGGVGV